MPSRTATNAKPKPLSDNDLEQIAGEIHAGRPPMVWFTAAAVGVTEGKSGKIVSLGDPADADFLQIRPTGSKDVLSFGPAEVTLTKPPRDRPAASAPKPAPDKKETPVSPAASPSTPAAAATKPTPGPAATTAKKTTPNKATQESKPTPAPRSPAPVKPAKAPAARKTKGPEVTITVNGTADGEWTVDVASGKKRTVRAAPVAGTAVAQAAQLLHPEAADVVDGLLESVRGVQEAKVAQLQAELEQARRVLEDLSD